jgi:hypothetical protein
MFKCPDCWEEDCVCQSAYDSKSIKELKAIQAKVEKALAKKGVYTRDDDFEPLNLGFRSFDD